MKEVIVRIEKYDNLGNGIAHYNNKIMFIPEVFVNELVKVEIKSEKKKIYEVKLLNIIESSDIRITSTCKYKMCGGCNFLNTDYLNELSIKKHCFKNLFNYDSDIKIIKSEKFLNYRNKIILHFDKKIGLYEKSSNKIVNINKCMLVKEDINNIISELNLISFKDIEKIIIKSGIDNIVIIYSNSKIKENLSNLSANNIINIVDNNIYIIKGREYIFYNVKKYKFKSTLDSFFQTNTIQITNIIDYIKKSKILNINDNLLELYCGNGSLGIQLSKCVKNVFGIEINKYSIKDAEENIKINKIKNAMFIYGDLNTLNDIKKGYNKVLLDPPRNGLSKNIINFLLDNNFESIIYISCNPLTLKNDINHLKEKYIIKKITLFDMFPRTNHVECVTLMTRK